MSYERRVTILDGIEVPSFSRKEFEYLFDDYIKHYPNAEIIRRCADYFSYENIKDITIDDFCDYLCDNDIVLFDEFLDYAYIGEQIFEIGNEKGSFAKDITTLPEFPKIKSYIFDFIQKCFPKYHINRYIISWVL